jgi:hypothetical protein
MSHKNYPLGGIFRKLDAVYFAFQLRTYPLITFYTPWQNNLDQRGFAHFGASAQSFRLYWCG